MYIVHHNPAISAARSINMYMMNELSLPSVGGRQIEYQPDWLGLKQGTFTCWVAGNTVWSHMAGNSAMAFP